MIIQALLVSLVALLAYSSNKFLGDSMLNRPLVTATLTGLVLGDLQTGLIMAGTLELTWMGIMYLGLSMPSDVAAGAIIGTSYSILSGADVSVALTISIPSGMLCAYVATAVEVAISFWMPKVDKYAMEGNIHGINRVHIGAGIIKAILTSSIIFLAVAFGTDMIETVINAIPKNILDGLNVVAGLLPALGFAMLLNIMWDKRFLPFYFIGFILVVYFKADIMSLTILAVAIAAYRFLNTTKEEN
ncbi:MAG: PTS sugar transporter subunit IIC [Bacilli bacterium]